MIVDWLFVIVGLGLGLQILIKAKYRGPGSLQHFEGRLALGADRNERTFVCRG